MTLRSASSDAPRPGELIARARRQRERALGSGDLQPIATERCLVEDGGVPFSVRVLRGLDRKPRRARASDPPGRDPFLPPYEDDLFVADVSASHAVLLNKYPVVEDHLLVVTRRFEPQQARLTREDFAALCACMRQIDGLGFYNAGPAAGASQSHKHLQLVPLPFGAAATAGPAPGLPTEPLFASDASDFVFGQVALESAAPGGDAPEGAGDALHAAYRRLLEELSLEVGAETRPYNLLVTRRRMLVVPRSRDRWQGISVNAMGFAGSLLVRDDDALARLRAVGPRRLLAAVGEVPGGPTRSSP